MIALKTKNNTKTKMIFITKILLRCPPRFLYDRRRPATCCVDICPPPPVHLPFPGKITIIIIIINCYTTRLAHDTYMYIHKIYS